MKPLIIFGLWMAGLLTAAVALAEPVAMVTDVSGGVSILENGKARKILLLSYLEPKMTLQLDSNAHLTATFLSKPVEYRFTGPARLTVEQDRILTQDGKTETHTISLQKTSTAKKFTATQRERVTQAAFEMRAGGRPGLRLDDPVDTRLINSDALNFSWDSPQPKDGYQLSLYDRHNKLLHQTSSTSNSWTPSADLLKAGNAYEWEVRATLESGEVLTARGNFSVADEITAKTILAQNPPSASSFSDRVLYAVFLEEKGFKYAARRLWKALAKEHPDDLVAKEHSSR